MKKNIILLLFGMLFSGVIYSQTEIKNNDSENEDSEMIDETPKTEVVFRTQEIKDKKVAIMEERIKFLEAQEKAAPNLTAEEDKRYGKKSKLERAYERLELIKNAKVMNAIRTEQVPVQEK